MVGKFEELGSVKEAPVGPPKTSRIDENAKFFVCGAF